MEPLKPSSNVNTRIKTLYEEPLRKKRKACENNCENFCDCDLGKKQ